MDFKRRLTRSQPNLDVTPIADIVFLLLIFFMLSSSMVIEPGIRLKLPKAATAEVESSKQLVLSIDGKDRVYINRRQVRLGDLEEELRAQMYNRTDKSLLVRADAKVDHGTVMQVLDRAKLAGVERLALAAEKKQ